MKELISDSFREQAVAFPSAVDRALREVTTAKSAKGMLDKAVAMAKYAEQLKAGIEIERPIAIGVLKIKAKVAELSPPEKGGRGKKTSKAELPVFSKPAISAYRKIHQHIEKLDKYLASISDVPSQGEFIRFATGTEKAGAAAHVSLNTGVPEWYTPPEFIDAARRVLKGIDLDPASSRRAQKIVKAKKYYTIDDDGLKHKWVGRVWMNPPYTAGTIGKFTALLAKSHQAGEVTQAIALVNNATETEWFQELSVASAAICFPARRVKFIDENGDASGSPLQGQACMYLGPDVETFIDTFKSFGVCWRR